MIGNLFLSSNQISFYNNIKRNEMEILFYIGCAIFGLGLGALIAKTSMMKNKCNHNYKIIKDGEIVNYDSQGRQIVKGFMKVYECEHCKHLKSNKVFVN